jgi:LacI family transcriptional regulator
MARRAQVLLIVETAMAYGRRVLWGINRYVVAHQPWSLSLELRELMIEPSGWLDSWEGDGIISRSTTPKLAEAARRRGIPIVDLTDMHGPMGLPHIWNDHAQVGELAAGHLLERGFRQFGFCGFSDHDWSRRRRDAFISAVEKAGGSCDVFESTWSPRREQTWQEQQAGIAAWLERLPKPAGVMACNDMRGLHVLDACRSLELAVPEEIAVVGVDNDKLLCELCDPPLSSVIPNPERIGYEAAKLLDGLMSGDDLPNSPLLIPPLGVETRQSTDVLAIGDADTSAAVRFIREHACEGISVEDVLKHVPLSRSALERRFRKFLNRSPQLEIRLVQLKRVKQLLAETDLPLDRIADLAGYAHPEYMSVVFKRELGITPGQFRKQTQ